MLLGSGRTKCANNVHSSGTLQSVSGYGKYCINDALLNVAASYFPSYNNILVKMPFKSGQTVSLIACFLIQWLESNFKVKFQAKPKNAPSPILRAIHTNLC